MSKYDAITILGHEKKPRGGEKILVEKFSRLLKNNLCDTYDLFELFGERYSLLAKLNYSLASSGNELLTDFKLSLPKFKTHHILVLSFSQSLAALLATGVQKKHRLISKLHVHHRAEKVFPLLYEECSLLITESLLANLRGAAYGIKESKMLFLPHFYPKEVDSYSQKEAGKKVVIGIASRFERGKNCEYALEAVRRLIDKGYPLQLILMGDFEEETTDPEYQKAFKEMLSCYEEAPWFIWERAHLPLIAALQAYNRFDLALQLSGAEGGSHTIIELLGLGKPVVALDASTNPYLFKGGAYLVEANPEDHEGQLSYQVPNLDALEGALEAFVREPSLRKDWGKRGKQLARERFHEDIVREKSRLLFCEDPQVIQESFHADRKLYGL